MKDDEFVERLLGVMEAKRHWAWGAFTSGQVAPGRLHIHLEQEYATYVRDFPILVGRAYVQCPIAAVRRELAANLYEEETGGIAAGRPHPELFLEIPRALGMDMRRFEHVELLPAAATYRDFLDRVTTNLGWQVAAAVTTLFIEGTQYERGELDPEAAKRPQPPLEQHPLVVHYGLPVEALVLTRVHREVENSHRASAWTTIRDHVSALDREVVVETMGTALSRWLDYRDDVAKACGVEKGVSSHN